MQANLSRDTRFNPSYVFSAAAIIILTALAFLAWSASPTKLLNCDMDCGETLLATQGAAQFVLHGIQYGLLENMGTPQAPWLYTHNVNIGTLTFTGLQALGIPPAYHFFLPLAVHGLGLFYLFLTVRRVSGSDLAALITLLVFASSYWGLGTFALNALRSWHMLSFFVVVFHTIGVLRRERPLAEGAGLVFGAIIAFGCGYDFWIICGAVSGMLALANVKIFSWREIARVGAIITFAFAVPFILRQIQIVAVLGASYWAQDFIYSVGIKIPYADRLLGLPPLAEIDAYYVSQHVFRPPAQPGNTAEQIYFTFRHMVTRITVPRWGWISLLTLLAMLAGGILRRRSALGAYSARLILPMMIGVAIGLAVFAPFSLHVYFKHEFPLFVFPLLLATGIAIYGLASVLIARRNKLTSGLAGAVLAFLIFDIAMVHWNNSVHAPVPNYGWLKTFNQVPADKVALTVYRMPPTANPFFEIDDKRAVYITAKEMLEGPSDLTYWIYQPSDTVMDFDSQNPRCEWMDWIRRALNRPFKTSPGMSCIYWQPRTAMPPHQPNLDEMIALANNYAVIERSDRGIGYVILQRKDAKPTN